ncbi:hypothetical protein RD792_015959 [Penstemon davidsonii]|uniref:Uncharacterized protein n=1 Tax=Penstemon davidsonii TaxID=160366 RepID=A0ABR0CIC9_9LAMI|nr:hypothetical protein RD792_015959 [Penstemon davidsonii]
MEIGKSSSMLIIISFLAILLASQTQALVPYTRPLLDIMFPQLEDPLKILEHSPLSIPRATPDADALALARADWKETPAAHVISLDIPGMKKEDVKIEVEENRLLRVSGERKTEEEVKDEQWHRVERTVGKFWRQFRLPANADLEKVGAELEDGVLRITVPKLAEKEVKREPKVISIDDKGKKKSGEQIVQAKPEL